MARKLDRDISKELTRAGTIDLVILKEIVKPRVSGVFDATLKFRKSLKSGKSN